MSKQAWPPRQRPPNPPPRELGTKHPREGLEVRKPVDHLSSTHLYKNGEALPSSRDYDSPAVTEALCSPQVFPDSGLAEESREKPSAPTLALVS